MNIIPKSVEDFIIEMAGLNLIRMGLDASVAHAKRAAEEFVQKFLEETVELLDNSLREHPEYRPGWTIQKKEPRTLVTTVGTLNYERRYYKNKKTGERAYLVDRLLSIPAYERISTENKVALCTEVVEHSYRESAQIVCNGQISKQSVLRIIKEANLPKAPVLEQGKEEVRELHIQADEDHVAMQDGRCCQARIAVVHLPVQRRGKRRSLPQKRYILDQGETCESFWNRVWEDICENYKLSSEAVIYLHGDGAAWIKAGAQFLPSCKFVLDRFHVMKALKTIVSVKHPLYRDLVKTIYEGDLKRFGVTVRRCLGEEGRNPEKQRESYRYCRSHWSGIRIWKEKASGPSCAEGLVSHYLSARLSSRPMAWLDSGLYSLLKLKEYKLNGGRISIEHFRKPERKKSLDLPTSAKMALARVGHDFAPLATEVYRRAKRDPLRTLFNEIKWGGFRW